MQRINSESLSLWPLFQKLAALEENEVELVLSATSPLLENLLSLKILKAEVLGLGKKITFLFEDKNFNHLSFWLNGQPPAPGPTTPPEMKAPVSPAFKFKPRRAFFLFLVPLLLAGAGLLALYFLGRAKVTLYLDSETLAKTIDVLALPNVETIQEDPPTIPALEIATSLQKSESSPSSGKKEVGEKATGTMTIYNKTTGAVSFPAGTILSQGRLVGDDLRFLSKEKVEVPGRAADATAVGGYTPGTVGVAVVAENLGEEFNLPAGQNFSVAGRPTSDFIAQNATELTGGSRRQVIVVTADDQRKLYDLLLDGLKEELKKDILAKVVPGQTLETEKILYETKAKSYDHAVGDEADRLTLNLEVKAQSLAFLKSDLDDLAARLLASFVPDGYELFSAEQEVTVVQTESLDGRLKILARAKGFIVPKIEAESVARKLAGQKVSLAKDYLGSLTKVSSYSLERFPDFSFWPFLPFRLQNLRVEVVRK